MNAITREQQEELKTRIEPLRQQVESWRQNKAGNEHMPEPLWEAAIALAKVAVSFSPLKGDFVGRAALARQHDAFARVVARDYALRAAVMFARQPDGRCLPVPPREARP